MLFATGNAVGNWSPASISDLSIPPSPSDISITLDSGPRRVQKCFDNVTAMLRVGPRVGDVGLQHEAQLLLFFLGCKKGLGLKKPLN